MFQLTPRCPNRGTVVHQSGHTYSWLQTKYNACVRAVYRITQKTQKPLSLRILRHNFPNI